MRHANGDWSDDTPVAGTPLVPKGRRRREATRTTLAVAGAFVMVVFLGTVGYLVLRPDPAPGQPTSAGATDPGTSAPPTSAAVVTTPPPSVTTPAPSTSTRKVLPRPTSTVKPPAKEQPPAPQPPGPTRTTDCPSYSGPKAPFADVKASLTSSASHQYWVGVQRPSNLVGPLPTITVPLNLMKAIAWQESGWQSTIIACDDGVGTMQIMPGTQNQVNNRFGENFDRNTLAGNTALGAAYLEWLVMWFGTVYFVSPDGTQNFDWNTEAALGPNGETVKLRDAVIASYNVGPNAVGNPDTKVISFGPTARTYLNNVLALMSSCPCSAY
jgi:hypothetical protein